MSKIRYVHMYYIIVEGEKGWRERGYVEREGEGERGRDRGGESVHIRNAHAHVMPRASHGRCYSSPPSPP